MMVNRYPARNQLSAKFSLPFAVATTLFHGKATTEAFQDDKVKLPILDTIARKVEVIASPELTKRWPAEVSARVKISLTDGQVLEGYCKNAYGYWQNPCTTQDLIDKFRDLTKTHYQEQAAEQIYDLFVKLPEYSSFVAFMDDLRKI